MRRESAKSVVDLCLHGVLQLEAVLVRLDDLDVRHFARAGADHDSASVVGERVAVHPDSYFRLDLSGLLLILVVHLRLRHFVRAESF